MPVFRTLLALASAVLFVSQSCAPSRSAAPRVARPVAPASAPPTSAAPTSLEPRAVDAALRAAWSKANVTPSARADDATFLRRAYLDVVGTIPEPAAVEAFLADDSPLKRARLVDELLASPAYADYWAAYWDDLLMGPRVQDQSVDRAAFRAWLRRAFAENMPYDKLVYALVSATGQNSDGGPRNGGYADVAASQSAAPAGGVANGAVNWILKYADAPQDLAGSASRTFLGVQIQCAQCHDHKTEKWKQEDFQRFSACFAHTRLEPIDAKAMGGQVRRVVVEDVRRAPARFQKNGDLKAILESRPAALDGTDLSSKPDARVAIAEWMTSPQNPWFAHAIVNRMWGHFLGRGFVDPVDDIRQSNPPEMPDVLQAIAGDFAGGGYDLKRLVRLIAATEVYQLAAAPGGGEIKLWSRFRLSPLGPGELLSALMTATKLDRTISQTPRMDLDRIRAQLSHQYAFLFDVDEELDRASFEGTIAQALTLLNGSATGTGSSALPGGIVAEVVNGSGGREEKIQAVYLRVLSRRASPEEVAYWKRYIGESEPAASPAPSAGAAGKADPLRRLEARDARRRADARTAAYEDLVWALLNSSEFTFNH